MFNVIYSIIIFPLVQIIELSFLFVYRIFGNIGISILGVSAIISICTLPLYLAAERLQQKERDLQKHFKPKIQKIKSVFKGDEQYMVLNTYYRQNHYHPIYAMRNTFSLLIQIPFFIAAYSFLSHFESMQRESFLFIKNLGKPDMFLSFFGGINILPVLMTVINCISGALYTRYLGLKDKIQVFGMALIFLVLLYNSPSGLVLYWTGNNIFSFVKHILSKSKYTKRIIYGFLCVFSASMSIFVLFFHSGSIIKRFIVFFVCLLIFILPFIRRISQKFGIMIKNIVIDKDSILLSDKYFILSLLILFLLAGLVIPSQLISSSIAEFSFIESYKTPFPFIFNTVLQGIGILIFWPLCIYYFSPQKIKYFLSFLAALLSAIFLINTFIFPAKYGFLTITLTFFNSVILMYDNQKIIINTLILILFSGFFVFLLLFMKKKYLFSIHYIIVISLSVFGLYNFYKIGHEYRIIANPPPYTILESQASHSQEMPAVFTLSNSGNNVIVIILDMAISGYLPYIFKEKPELYSKYSGFIYYPNCVSFSTQTSPAMPAVYGGYEYTTEEINRQKSVLFTDKANDSYFVQFKLFSDAGYKLTANDYVFDGAFDNPDFWRRLKEIPELQYEQLEGKYTTQWLSKHPDIELISITNLLKNTLFRFSFFRMSPVAFRGFLYDNGLYLSTENLKNKITARKKADNDLIKKTIDNYAVLDYLPNFTQFTSDFIYTYNVIYNMLPHEPAFFEAPDYIPQSNVTNRGGGIFSQEKHYHVNISSLLLLGKYFDTLKKNNSYDNTRIIIVSDHGANMSSPFPDNIILPNGRRVQDYNPLLLYKDFNAHDELKTDNTFMTNADTLFLAMEGIIENPVNPFTGIPMKQQKKDGVSIATLRAWMPKYVFTIGKNNWLHVRDNIFDAENWTLTEKP